MTRNRRRPVPLPRSAIAVFAVMALTAVCGSAIAQKQAEAVYGIAPYPGSARTGVESAEKLLLASGYKLAVCRRTGDGIDKVVAHYRKDRQLELVGEALSDNATFGVRGRSGAALQINSPWMDSATFVMNKDTLICVAGRSASE